MQNSIKRELHSSYGGLRRETMLNFRKLKQDLSPNILKEGRSLFERDAVVSAKIVTISPGNVRLSCQVLGQFDNAYECELEIDRLESVIVDSDCDCTYKYDCQHLAAILFYLETHFDEIVVDYSRVTDLEKVPQIDEEEKEQLRETFKEAESKEVIRKGRKHQVELLQEYISAADVLGRSPYFLPEEHLSEDLAELAVIFTNQPPKGLEQDNHTEIQLVLRLPTRSKPLVVPDVKAFLDSVRYGETLYLASRRHFFGLGSFDMVSAEILRLIMDNARTSEQNPRIAQLSTEILGEILARAYELVSAKGCPVSSRSDEPMLEAMPGLYLGTFEQPLRYSRIPVRLRFELEYLEMPAPKLLLNPILLLDGGREVRLEEARMFECAKPGLINEMTYYRFDGLIRRKHLRHLQTIRGITVPEPLFGTFVENALPELMRFAEVSRKEVLEKFVTLPFVGEIKALCDISYLDGELEATLHFLYDKIKVPAALSQIKAKHLDNFTTTEGILARNLTEEQKIIDDLFQDFHHDEKSGSFTAKNDKKIVEFMTEVVPRNQARVAFNCPENLLDQFVYDDSRFKLDLRETDRIDIFEAQLVVRGPLNGVSLDLLWDCIASRRPFIELQRKKPGSTRKGAKGGLNQVSKILVLNLAELSPVVQIFDELGIKQLDDHTEERPLWSLASIDASLFDGLPIQFSMSERLKAIQGQMIGVEQVTALPIPKQVSATLRNYQVEGVAWLERLRHMHLSGILADDMGLGKTLQAITALTQYKQHKTNRISLVVCPTSLVYNWVEECSKFNKHLRVLPVDGTPAQRKKLLERANDYDLVVTSYSLLQKDIEIYQEIPFGYAILDEAQHIKNRGTRNAKSVKLIQAAHRLILTGTPIENSLEELWSLFDFLLPGLLSSFDRFLEKYIRTQGSSESSSTLSNLKRKVSPFILRRMKKDLLTDLPPVSEIVYHCHLAETQKELYRSYANSAREELSKLVKKEGFDKVQIHVLATLTRLKQICCHPAIFAKDAAETGDSAKYDMLIELLESLIEGQHKAVVFSQYTRMLKIMRDDLQRMGVRFSYLDGSSKDRMSIVKEFNEDAGISVFLVSLKAGGSGLNLTSADTVIHYDMWWNPAVENQATDRVHRIGQSQSVSSYKLVTLNTIEEKILELQQRKKGLVTQVVNCDEEVVSKLTWEEVLELLQT